MSEQDISTEVVDSGVGNVDDGVGEAGDFNASLLSGNEPATAETTEPGAAAEAAAGLEPAKEPAAAAPKPDEEAPVEAPWDTARQDADQENANLRKDNVELRRQLDERGSTAATRVSDDDLGNQLDDLDSKLEAVGEKIAGLDDLADASELKPLLKEQHGYQVQQAKVQRTLADNSRATREEMHVASEASQHSADKAAYRDIMDKVCGEVGEEHRNPLLKRMSTLWTERGYTAENLPSADQVEDAAFSIGRELAMAAPAKPTSTSPKKPAIASDTGAGGAPSGSKQTTGSMADMTTAMQKEGKFG